MGAVVVCDNDGFTIAAIPPTAPARDDDDTISSGMYWCSTCGAEVDAISTMNSWSEDAARHRIDKEAGQESTAPLLMIGPRAVGLVLIGVGRMSLPPGMIMVEPISSGSAGSIPLKVAISSASAPNFFGKRFQRIALNNNPPTPDIGRMISVSPGRTPSSHS